MATPVNLPVLHGGADDGHGVLLGLSWFELGALAFVLVILGAAAWAWLAGRRSQRGGEAGAPEEPRRPGPPPF